MGLWDRLSGTRRPPEGVAPGSAAEVREALLAVNRPTAPFVVRDGAPDGVDLVAEWRIVDAIWYEIFAKAGMRKSCRIFMRLDESAHEVRAVDEEFSVEWHVGVPHLSFEKSMSRGQTRKVEFGRGWAFTERGRFGEVYNYRFSSGELRSPLQNATTATGWTWRGIAFGAL